VSGVVELEAELSGDQRESDGIRHATQVLRVTTKMARQTARSAELTRIRLT